jgi:hypothetical protein
VPARLGDPEVREFGHFRRVATRDPLARLAGVPFLPLRYFPQQFTSPDLRAYADVPVAYITQPWRAERGALESEPAWPQIAQS